MNHPAARQETGPDASTKPVPAAEPAWSDPTDAAIATAADRILAAPGALDPAALAAIDRCVERIAWVTGPGEIEEPKLGFLLRHWLALAEAAGGVPDRHAIDVVDLVPVLGNLLMLEVERDGLDAIYRVYGTAVADRAARDWTGFRVSEMNRTTRTPAALLYRACYLAVFRRPAPLFTQHRSPAYLNVGSWCRLVLPLADGDRPCGRFLVCSVPVGSRTLSNDDLREIERRIQRPLPPSYPGPG